MIQLDKTFIAIDDKEINENLEFIEFDISKNYNNSNPALKIDFKNNNEYSVQCIKKLLEFEKNNINFLTSYNNSNIKYIILNYPPEVDIALKAISIKDEKERITFLYDDIVKSLDNIWETQSPCKFCNNVCIASKNGYTAHTENGCCYSFEYSKNPFVFIKNVKLCEHLGKDKKQVSVYVEK